MTRRVHCRRGITSRRLTAESREHHRDAIPARRRAFRRSYLTAFDETLNKRHFEGIEGLATEDWLR